MFIAHLCVSWLNWTSHQNHQPLLTPLKLIKSPFKPMRWFHCFPHNGIILNNLDGRIRIRKIILLISMRLLKPKTILVDSLRRIIRIFFLAIFVRRIILLTSVQKWMRFIDISPTRNILVAYYLDPFVSFLFVSSGLFKSCPCTRGHGSYLIQVDHLKIR